MHQKATRRLHGFSERAEKVSVFRGRMGAVHLGKMGRAFPFSPDQYYKVNAEVSCIRAGGWICSSLRVNFDLCTSAHLL